ncbi:MAG: methylated-DNA--[protein]-cysteine S-methyltransferase [Rikenellaceae bacterium]
MAVYNSALGNILIEHTNSCLTRLMISHAEPLSSQSKDNFTDMVFAQITDYITGSRREFNLNYSLVNLTPFQQKVYKELTQIPYSKTITYKQLAQKIGSPKASRAVGSACKKNPLHLIIPCHRVIASSGQLSGYAGGEDTKEFLLNLESSLSPQ